MLIRSRFWSFHLRILLEFWVQANLQEASGINICTVYFPTVSLLRWSRPYCSSLPMNFKLVLLALASFGIVSSAPTPSTPTPGAVTPISISQFSPFTQFARAAYCPGLRGWNCGRVSQYFSISNIALTTCSRLQCPTRFHSLRRRRKWERCTSL